MHIAALRLARRQRSPNAAVTRRGRDGASCSARGTGSGVRAATSAGLVETTRRASKQAILSPCPSPSLLRLRPGLHPILWPNNCGGREGGSLPARESAGPSSRRATARASTRAPARPAHTPPPWRFALDFSLACRLFIPPTRQPRQSKPAAAAAEARRQECECEDEADRAEGPVGTRRPGNAWLLANPIPRPEVRAHHRDLGSRSRF
jgi:hypothetical protein